jgi:Flp pilus assembly protein TadB
VNPIVPSFLVAFAVGIIALTLTPVRRAIAVDSRKESAAARMRKSLRLAGMFDAAPTFVIIGYLFVSLIFGAVMALLLQSPFAFIGAPIIVGFSGHLYLVKRQRTYIKRATTELVPFLNRMSAGVRAGIPASSAYVEAVREAGALKQVLQDSAAEIISGTPFNVALLKTTEKLPLRMWVQFCDAMDAHSRSGGDLAKYLEVVVTQMNEMLAMQAEMRAEYVAYSNQQWSIAGLTSGVILFMLIKLDRHQAALLFTTIPGVIALIAGVGLMLLGIYLGRVAVRNIERRMRF